MLVCLLTQTRKHGSRPCHPPARRPRSSKTTWPPPCPAPLPQAHADACSEHHRRLLASRGRPHTAAWGSCIHRPGLIPPCTAQTLRDFPCLQHKVPFQTRDSRLERLDSPLTMSSVPRAPKGPPQLSIPVPVFPLYCAENLILLAEFQWIFKNLRSVTWLPGGASGADLTPLCGSWQQGIPSG